MSEGLNMIHDTLDFFSGKKSPEIKLYGKWIFCCKEKCDEGYKGQCHLRNVIRDYPENNLCYEPEYVPYEKELVDLGVLENTEAYNG